MATSGIAVFATVEDVYKALQEKTPIHKKFGWSHPKKTKGKSLMMSLGRIWFNLLMPSDFPLYDEPISQKKLDSICVEIANKYPPEEAAKYIQNINLAAFKLTTFCPSTFDVDAMIVPDYIQEKKDELNKVADTLTPQEYEKELENITNDIAKFEEEEGHRIHDVLVSNVKGDINSWKALLVEHGYVADVEGNISKKPIKSSLVDGHNVEDYYLAAGEARRGFYYKAAQSSVPGYLARRVTMANANLVIDTKTKDCKTKRYYELVVTDKNAKYLKDRYYMDGASLKKIDDPSKLVGKKIQLRSPIYCKSKKGICPTCFGDLWQRLNTVNVGILAGGNINNVALNTYMKLRHKSSIPKIKYVDFPEVLKNQKMLDNPDFLDAFDIQKTEISAKKECSVVIDLNDYDEHFITEYGNYYLIPGIVTVVLSNEQKSFTFPFTFNVKLMIPENFEKDQSELVFKYVPGEVILQQETYLDEINVSIIGDILEGRCKFATTPESLVTMLADAVGYKMDLVFFELVISNMFRDADDPTLPARLTNYKNFEVVGAKKLPFIISWESALAFENPKKAIKTALLSGTDAPLDPITKIVNEDYS